MSLMVEFGGFLGGVLTECAERYKWSGRKIFVITFLSFFLSIALYILLVPPLKDIWSCLLVAAASSGVHGVICVALISYARRRERRKSDMQE
ncbi:hypothetical protein [Pseudoduganella albidiflava]|uniref:Uncharacterized protein n=1 Tax=Pseudoduganella albidiflava TaxID=321983 RepID=A0A411WSK2_9BURK|nr:hypothetical protein [Pseudoduganella albidiflava]QBH99627.1 hypothetical protein EYF70_01270 [Pseudoduganella albidiflava]GGY46300.1 hypothetical protein GCM10007387_30560 [Pseudoduganella albidiflava]